MNFLKSMQREPGLTAEDCLLSVTTLSFDISWLKKVFLPLTTGAAAVVGGLLPAVADGPHARPVAV